MRLSAPAVAVLEREADPREPVSRLAQLLDPNSLVALHLDDASGVRAVRGHVDGKPVVAYCTDATAMGGALGAEGSHHIVQAIEAGVRERWPVIGLWHSGGARLADGVESMDGVGRMFAAMTRASGRVPQLSVVLGPAAGAAAYGPALTDLVIMSTNARVFVTGPDVVRAVTGEQIDMADLGGADVHGRRSGVVHVVAESEADAFRRARRITGYFTRPGLLDPTRVRLRTDLLQLLPEKASRAYDVRPLVRAILDGEADGSGFDELQARWAANVIVGLGRLAGRAVGVIANNPLRKGGCLDSLSAEKAARFVRMCDCLGVPMLVIVDVPGYLPGVSQEWEGIVRRGAKLLHAFAESVVPRVTLVTRKSYGGAYIAMNSRALGATRVFAWPSAEIGVMSARAAVQVIHRRALAAAGDERDALLETLVSEHERISGGIRRALAINVVDEVIDPAETRLKLAEALACAPAGRGSHTNIPL